MIAAIDGSVTPEPRINIKRNVRSTNRKGRNDGLRPDIVVAIRWYDWDAEWIKWIFRFKYLVEFIPDNAVGVVNMGG